MNARELLSIGLDIDPNFQGVFARDEVPPMKKCLIFNTDERGKPGAHWQAIYNAEFFCSYAIPPPFKGLKQIITEPVQSVRSSTCGLHCLYFLHCRRNKLPLKYTNNTRANDKLVSKWLRGNYNMGFNIYDEDFLINQICIEYMPHLIHLM